MHSCCFRVVGSSKSQHFNFEGKKRDQIEVWFLGIRNASMHLSHSLSIFSPLLVVVFVIFIQGLEYFETSAATQQGNLDPFHFMADQFRRKYQEEVNSQGEFERD